MRVYAELGVPWAWLVDPQHRLVEVYALTEGHWLQVQVVSEEPEALLPPFDAVPFDVRSLWVEDS